MLWGKSIFPTFAVNAPMPFTARRPKPTEVPGEIQVAIADLIEAVQRDMNEMSRESMSAMNAADRALSAAILKELRGDD